MIKMDSGVLGIAMIAAITPMPPLKEARTFTRDAGEPLTSMCRGAWLFSPPDRRTLFGKSAGPLFSVC